ncbi:AI-2E family transporter [Clostridium chauvoei]|uniref:AI-2E family transporter n=2 Tax=Clostridium chauvoei TaxID=46867 RepID=UPI001C84BB92|nr:AI-2E family transporter [Clostridium chauvoei]MBX7361164.1 AI-2E family transporter [Clostridium chauvoei]MBX7363841.1 AI-2E family transporter [Clostridium chauvoei]MBX7372093.1 AI-2E family transporter [Clostridium chauvoei]MBX7387213.1 AI-2E family transporter [Clostridium chauvoei]MBX7407279.1 AI-2E family transporter [Clostridium chauvoei]
MLEKLRIENKYIRCGIYGIISILVLFLGYKIIDNGSYLINNMKESIFNFFNIISPVFYAFLISYLLFRPVVFFQNLFSKLYNKITKKQVSDGLYRAFRILGIIIMFGIIIITLALVINFIIPPIIENIKILLNKLPEYQIQMKVWIEGIVESLNKNNIDIQTTGELATVFTDKLFLFGNEVLAFITNSITSLSSFLLDLILTIILTFYFLKDKEILFRNFRKFRDVIMPGKVGRFLTIFFNDIDEIVGKFLVAEILDSVIVGVVSTILMLIINHPFAILIGCVAGFTNIIPYIGPVIGAALAFGLGIFNTLSLGITGAILLLLYQQIDGNFVQPKIVGDKVGLVPVWILIVVLIGGSYFGAIGMILSIPIAGIIRIYFNRYEKSKNII